MQRGQPPFQREEKTLDLPNALGTLPNQGKKNQNLKQKVEARKDVVSGGDFFFVWFVVFCLVGFVLCFWLLLLLFCGFLLFCFFF